MAPIVRAVLLCAWLGVPAYMYVNGGLKDLMGHLVLLGAWALIWVAVRIARGTL